MNVHTWIECLERRSFSQNWRNGESVKRSIKMEQTRQINDRKTLTVLLTPGKDDIRNCYQSEDQFVVVLQMDVHASIDARLGGEDRVNEVE